MIADFAQSNTPEFLEKIKEVQKLGSDIAFLVNNAGIDCTVPFELSEPK